MSDGDAPAAIGIQSTTQLSRVPGVALDPPPRDLDATAARLDERHPAAGLVYLAVQRFLLARVSLLAAGTAYYIFLALISLLAFAYGLFALFGTEKLAALMTVVVDSAFPGLLGSQGVSPEALRNLGSVSSIVGLGVLAFSGTGSVQAANHSFHMVFGVPRDPRNFVWARTRMLGQMLVIGPLILASFAPSLLLSRAAAIVRERLGLEAEIGIGVLIVLVTLGALALNYVVLWLMMSWLGGVRPPQRARVIGALFGALIIEVLRGATALIVSASLNRPQYGAFAVPIALLLMLFLMTVAAYSAACLTAVIAVRSQGSEVDSNRTLDP